MRLFKAKSHEAIQRTQLTRKQIYERAEIGRETLRKALYGRGGKLPAEKITCVLGEELDLSEEEREAIREELATPSQKISEKNFENMSRS